MKRRSALRPVEVTWHDCTTHEEWRDRGDAETLRPVRCTTVGYLVKRSNRWVTLAGHNMPEDEQVGSVHTIPMKWVTTIRRLR